MTSAAVAEFLEERLFGEKSAITPLIMSAKLSIGVQDAREALSKFLDAHSSELSATYVVKEVDKKETPHITTYTIQSGESVTSNGEFEPVLHTVSPGNAADAAILSKLARDGRKASVKIKLNDLASRGFIVNPILNGEESASSGVAGRVPVVPAKEPKLEPSRPAPKQAAKPAQPVVSIAKPKPAVKPAAKAAAPAKKGGFQFQKATKEEAHAQAFAARSSKVVNEAVVAADSPTAIPDSEDELEEREVEDTTRAQQLEKLNNLFDGPASRPRESAGTDGDVAMGQYDAGAAGDVEMGSESESEGRDQDVEMEAQIEPEPEPEPEPENGAELEVEESRDSGSAPRRRRVWKTVNSVDEEGMIVSTREQVWEDIEEPEEEQGPEPKKEVQKLELPKIPSRKPKSKGPVKQQTLTSFFKKA